LIAQGIPLYRWRDRVSQFSNFVFNRISAAVLIRTIGLVSAAAIIAGVPAGGAFGNRLADDTAVSGPKNGQSIAQREPHSDYRAYAQVWWPFEQNFGSSERDIAPRQNFDSPRADDGRNDAQASEAKQKVIRQLRTAPPVPPTYGPLLLIVSIPKQTVTLYDAGVMVVQSPVSTGTSSNPTPTGIFSVIEKHWWHRSNIYSAASMPFMQRITWEGVALHAGELPGYAASHGCIRLPYDFALRLWGTTNIGTRVIISNDDLAPLEIAHSQLFTLRSTDVRAREFKPEYRTAFVNKSQPASAPISMNVPVAPSSAPGVTLSGSSPRILEVPSEQNLGLRGAAISDANVTPLGKRHPADVNNLEGAGGVEDDASPYALQRLESIDSSDTVINGTAEVSIVRPSLPTEISLLNAEKIPGKADWPPNEPGNTVASLDAPIAPTSKAPVQAQPAYSPIAPPVAPSTAQETVLRPGPVSILVSQRDQRMYVRKGLEPLFDVPIAIARLGRPLGTHVFTAVALRDDGVTLRWMVVSMPSTLPAVPTRMADKSPLLAAARDALDRLDLPKEAADRVTALMSVGASLIVTDQGLGRAATALDSDYMISTR
jgi:lipoprotein-anchoring transpeptidase ErfK/SrfK